MGFFSLIRVHIFILESYLLTKIGRITNLGGGVGKEWS